MQGDPKPRSKTWMRYLAGIGGVAVVVGSIVLAQRFLADSTSGNGEESESRPPVSILPGETLEEAVKRVEPEKQRVEIRSPAEAPMTLPEDATEETRTILEEVQAEQVKLFEKNMAVFREVRSTPGFEELRKYQFPVPERMDLFRHDVQGVARTFLEKTGKLDRVREAARTSRDNPEKAATFSKVFKQEAERVRQKADERFKNYDPAVANAALEAYDDESKALYTDTFYTAFVLAEVAQTLSTEFDRLAGPNARR